MMLALFALAPSLAAAAVADDCNRSRGGDIVICGSRKGESPYRLPKLPDRYDAKRIRAETGVIPGVQTRAHLDTSTRPDGLQDHRIMVTFALPF